MIAFLGDRHMNAIAWLCVTVEDHEQRNTVRRAFRVEPHRRRVEERVAEVEATYERERHRCLGACAHRVLQHAARLRAGRHDHELFAIDVVRVSGARTGTPSCSKSHGFPVSARALLHASAATRAQPGDARIAGDVTRRSA